MNYIRASKALPLACLLLASQARGQGPDSRIDQARLRTGPFALNPAVQGEPSGRVVETPGDPDLGKQVILPLSGGAAPWSFFASAADYYTDNVTLANASRQADGYFFSEAGVRYQRNLTESLSMEATVRQGFFRYHDLGSQDFNSLNAGAGLYQELKELWNITVFGRYNFERLTDDSFGQEFLANHTLTAGAQKTFAWQDGYSAYVGCASMFAFTRQSASQRNEHSLYAGTKARLTHSLDADVYARLALFDYRQGGRRDLNGIITAALTYHVNPHLSVNASYSFVFDRSNRSRFDYDASTTGGGVTFRYQF